MATHNQNQRTTTVKTQQIQSAKEEKRIKMVHQKIEQEEAIEGQLALDVCQTPTEIIVLAPVAGVKTDDINVTVTEDVLTIKGRRYMEINIPDEDYLTQECFWGDFSRSIVLPVSVDTTKINASFKDGVLMIRIPRTEPTKTKVIRIKTE